MTKQRFEQQLRNTDLPTIKGFWEWAVLEANSGNYSDPETGEFLLSDFTDAVEARFPETSAAYLNEHHTLADEYAFAFMDTYCDCDGIDYYLP